MSAQSTSRALAVVRSAPETPITAAQRAQEEAIRQTELAIEGLLIRATALHADALDIAGLPNVPIPAREACRRIATALSNDMAQIRPMVGRDGLTRAFQNGSAS